jgi:hypothetical protein
MLATEGLAHFGGHHLNQRLVNLERLRGLGRLAIESLRQ